MEKEKEKEKKDKEKKDKDKNFRKNLYPRYLPFHNLIILLN